MIFTRLGYAFAGDDVDVKNGFGQTPMASSPPKESSK